MSRPFDVSVSTDWANTRARWAVDASATSCTPFQTLSFLDAWYASFASDAQPLLVDVMRSGEIAVRLAFALDRSGRELTFADFGVSDFNAPILGPAAPKIAADAQALWQTVAATLPRVDRIDLRKMPLAVAGRANPFALLGRTSASPVSGNLIDTSSWDTYHTGLDRRVRMEFERSWRVFQRTPGTQFVRVDEPGQALKILDAMDLQQRARLTELGQSFALDRPQEAAFYRHDLGRRLATGEVIMTALMADQEIVATLYALSNGQVPAVVRISNAGGSWLNASPGRLIVHRTLYYLATEGLRSVDLSIGDYDYKRRFSPIKMPLLDLFQAGSWRGQPAALKHRAVATLREHPAWDARVRRMFGKADPATGHVPKPKTGEA